MILNKHKEMNRITNLFNTKKDGILSVYFTAGYPQLDDTTKILKELQAKGIDMVEVGIPFSDPMARSSRRLPRRRFVTGCRCASCSTS